MLLCDDGEMDALIAELQAESGEEMVRVDRLLERFPEDPRLHFLRGSMLAGIGRPIEALAALKKAVAIAPDFAIARFQLGFFHLTSGEAGDALATWGPLALLPAGHYLPLFVGGLTHLIRDEFEVAAARLEQGIAANTENPALNRDITLILDQLRELRDQGEQPAGDDMGMSATSFLLDQFAGRRPS